MPYTNSRLTRVVLLLMFMACARGHLAGQTTTATRPPGTIDRHYTLVSTMLGYRGEGGEIDGIRNPTLWAVKGETVRITIVNGELMVHDVALQTLAVKSPEVLDKGAIATLTFTAKESDTYYCSIPGHRAAGMEGRFEVTDAAPVASPGVLPAASGTALEPGLRERHARRLDEHGRSLRPGERRRQDRGRSGGGSRHRSSSAAASRAASARASLRSAPFRVSHPYASFLVSGGAFASTRVEVVLVEGEQIVYSISGADQAMLRPDGRRSPPARGQAGLRPAGGRRDRADRGAVPQAQSVGLHQLRQLPLPRRPAVLPGRSHAGEQLDPAADGSRAARRAVARRGRAGDDGARRASR